MKELQSLGLRVELFDFDRQLPLELLSYDVVEMIGGNPYYLLNAISIHDFKGALRYVAKNKYLIGCKVIRLNDGDGVIIDGNHYFVVHK